MRTEEHTATYRKLVAPAKKLGMKSYAIVAIDESGEVFWGADFGFQPEVMDRWLRHIASDARQYAKKYA